MIPTITTSNGPQMTENTSTFDNPTRASDYFGCMTFSGDTMLKRLPSDVFAKLQRTMSDGTPLDPAIANTVAVAMKDWAIENGATHYCHWFQPLTGITAGLRNRWRPVACRPCRVGDSLLLLASPEAAGVWLLPGSGWVPRPRSSTTHGNATRRLHQYADCR